MNPPLSSLWQTKLPGNLDQRLQDLFEAAEKTPRPVRIFFRADDIGRIENNFILLMQLFADFDMPLCLALVPQWLSADNWQQIRSLVKKEDLFCWHQHGFNHINHEAVGKKCEFGESRSIEAIRKNILVGKLKLEQLLADSFLPVFTPPWNRCSKATMQVLQELNFPALSRSINVQPPPPAGLMDLAINIDLHTRKENDPEQGMDNLLAECKTALESGCMGFMLHHQRMNATAFLFLEHLLGAINAESLLVPCTFRELLKNSCSQCAGSGR
ncbi:MAG: polysaccharide deacetylase family protein [Deltaproteobacteria bacterium]|nr:polysaccharide deacetylase family protein [Deltaproteobacteria bacterium]